MTNAGRPNPEKGTDCPKSQKESPRTHHDGLGLNLSGKTRCQGRERADKETGAESYSSEMTRRRFLGHTAAGMAGLFIAPQILVPRYSKARERNSKIVRTFHPDATTGWTQVNQEPVDMMVHAAVRELTGIGHTGMAWKSLFPGIDATKRIGIKINLACGDVPTHPEVVNAIIDGLLMMDLDGETLPENQIIVWDLDTAFFCPQTGYTFNYGGDGVQYYGTDYYLVGHDMAYTFSIEHPHGSVSDHHPSSIITQRIDYLINAAVMKDHSDSEITLCLKNHYGSFDNINIYQMHTSGTWGDGHSRGEPELNRVLRDELGDKTKLWLIDATYGLYDGGPGYIPPYHTPPNWAYNSFLVGLDPVALDRIGTEKLIEERLNHGISIPLDPSHVTASAGAPYNLGTDKLEEIDLVEIDASLAADVHEGTLAPMGVALLSPYPNPAKSGCTFRLQCSVESRGEIIVTDASGARVRRVASGSYGPGLHRFSWDGKDESGRALASGIYFCQFLSNRGIRSQRVVMIH